MEFQLPPDDLRCPISLELMTDPVIIPSGHTFDRRSIQRWLDSGNLTCPLTNLPLPPNPRLIPNHALRSLISALAPPPPTNLPPCHDDVSVTPSSLADPAALAAILRRADLSAVFRRRLADSGAAASLLRLAADHRRPDLQTLSLRLLLLLSLDGDDARVGLVADGAVEFAAAALSSGSAAAAALAATLLTSLAVVEVNKCSIGASPAAIAALSAAAAASPSARARREAATALYELCKLPENRRRAVRAGAVPALVQLAGSGSERAVEVLALIGKCKEGREEMKRLDGLMGILAGVLRGRSPRGVEHALSLLNLVCSEAEEMASGARRQGILKICLGLAQEEEGRIAKNAIGLAQTLEKGEF